ncbi:hypothetical protein QYM36_009776 [Artemia franciscana]|uniref:Proteasome component Ecm29 N-terminal domain-containing protein n=1 Tax=Artemia franciscana TaxID=6661 RepID=A0AA88HRN5_ARTSF|nr:hypothetical protein QYM36_009776 [Artemia franciscana]
MSYDIPDYPGECPEYECPDMYKEVSLFYPTGPEALLERILLLISMAETDEKLEILVSRFLLPVILKLDSQEEGVRKKVLEVLVHLNKRMKSRPLLQLPMNQLVECLVKKNNSSFVKNFVLTYVKMGFPRLGPDTQVNLLPSLIKSLEEIPEKQQNGRNNGVDDDLIIRHALEFFDAAAVAAAKSTFLNKVLPGETCPRCAGNEATHNNEVPSVPGLMFSHLSSKLTRMEKVLNAVASRAEVYDNHFPSLPQLIEPNVLAIIVVSKIPASLDNPIKRKEMLDKVTGHEYCHKKKILGIAKGIPLDFDVDQFCSEPGLALASRLGASTVVRIEFTDLLSKARLLKTGLKIGYELVRVSEFLTPPRCCHK